MFDDTIAAISTPPGEGGIGIIRLSGPDAIKIAERVFMAGKSLKKPASMKSHTLTYGFIIDPATGATADEILMSVMKAPATYTREDVVEINSHGGIMVMKKILDILFREGARPAEPGEFTKRAFLNGRIDLLQAEAVMDIIKARTENSLRVACSQLQGTLSGKIRELYDRLAVYLSHIEADIDYPEDDISPVDLKATGEGVTEVIREVEQLLETADYGKICREGIKVTIAGRPNTGKSTLLNALLRENRAIVTEIPGTTRDRIEEYLNLGGFSLQLIDTAGIRNTSDPVEGMGVQKAHEAIEGADIILYLLDVSSPFSDFDFEIIKNIPSGKIILILNKIDLPKRLELPENLSYSAIAETSLLTRDGAKPVEDALLNTIFSGKVVCDYSYIISNLRHKRAILNCRNSLLDFLKALREGFSSDILAVDLKKALDFIGEITGFTVTEDILDRIFHNFCVGK